MLFLQKFLQRFVVYISLFFALVSGLFFVIYVKFLEIYQVQFSLQESLPYIIQDLEKSLRLFSWDNNKLILSFDFLKTVIVFIVSFIIIYAFVIYLSNFRTRSQRKLIQRAFSQYISPMVVKDILSRPESLSLGGKNAYLTVSFLDINNFSELASEYSPKDLVEYLNEYFSRMSEIIINNKGTVDKYLGDALMSFWGAPQAQDDHVIRACKTALEQQAALIKMRKQWKKEKKPEIRSKISLACGDLIVGNIGSKGHFNYTVIGESVNLAARLEKLNTVYGTDILVGDKVYHKAKHDFEFREIDAAIIHGFKKPVRIFELLAEKGKLKDGKGELVNAYHEALESFREKDYKAAKKAINHCLRIAVDDIPSQLLKEKIESMKEKNSEIEK